MHEPQSEHRLFWVATYHDGTVVYESEAPGEISSEHLDREALKRFGMVDDDGQERFGVDFPEGTDPQLVYRRRQWNKLRPVEVEEEDEDGVVHTVTKWEPDPHWTYLLGYHHADGSLEIWGMGADGEFRPDPEPDVELVDCEQH